MVDATGTVYVWKTAGTVNSLLGQTVLPEPFATGAGRLGMNLPAGARVDNFSGAALTP